jgi:hypothetical protein
MSDSKKITEPPHDQLRELAQQIYVEVASRVYSDTGTERARPQPKALAQMSFKLAEAFLAVDLEVNPAAIAAATATAKRSVDIKALQLDLESISKPR